MFERGKSCSLKDLAILLRNRPEKICVRKRTTDRAGDGRILVKSVPRSVASVLPGFATKPSLSRELIHVAFWWKNLPFKSVFQEGV